MSAVDITLDLSGLYKQWSAFTAQMNRGMREDVRLACEDGASEARSTHIYTNRTGRLQASTVGRLDGSDAFGAHGVLEAGMPYASFVDRWEGDGDGVKEYFAHGASSPVTFMSRGAHVTELSLESRLGKTIANASEVFDE